MPTRKYRSPERGEATHIVAVGLTVWENGTYTGSLSAWEPGGERMRHYPVLSGPVTGLVAPLTIEALQHAAQLTLDLWGEGALR